MEKPVKFKSQTIYNNQVSVPSVYIERARERKVPLVLCYCKAEAWRELIIPWDEIEKYGYELPRDFENKYKSGTYRLWNFRLPRADAPKKAAEIPQNQMPLL